MSEQIVHIFIKQIYFILPNLVSDMFDVFYLNVMMIFQRKAYWNLYRTYDFNHSKRNQILQRVKWMRDVVSFLVINICCENIKVHAKWTCCYITDRFWCPEIRSTGIRFYKANAELVTHLYVLSKQTKTKTHIFIIRV